MSNVVSSFKVHIDQVEGYAFRTHFDKQQYTDLVTDEPPPLGKDSEPNPARILAAAVGNCLAASLLFCLSKAGAKPTGLSADVNVELVRNDNKRLRIGTLDVVLRPQLADDAALAHCMDLFEDFCVVTESVRQGLDVKVHVQSHPESTMENLPHAV
ncbi:MAG TPA: OsmC family protein [Polyangiaceae bacterium]|nr:OsmC family protein [Polyangiaceae bacterium]